MASRGSTSDITLPNRSGEVWACVPTLSASSGLNPYGCDDSCDEGKQR